MIFTHGEGLDWPDNLTVLRHPLHTAHCSFKFGWVGICWHWNVDLHVVGSGTPFKLTLCLRRTRQVKFKNKAPPKQAAKPVLWWQLWTRAKQVLKLHLAETTSAQQGQDITHYFLLPLIASTCHEATKDTHKHTQTWRHQTLIMYSIRLWECFSITDSIQIKGFT